MSEESKIGSDANNVRYVNSRYGGSVHTESEPADGVPFTLRLTTREYAALGQIAHRDKRGIKEQIRWLIEEYWLRNLRYVGGEPTSRYVGLEVKTDPD